MAHGAKTFLNISPGVYSVSVEESHYHTTCVFTCNGILVIVVRFFVSNGEDDVSGLEGTDTSKLPSVIWWSVIWHNLLNGSLEFADNILPRKVGIHMHIFLQPPFRLDFLQLTF